MNNEADHLQSFLKNNFDIKFKIINEEKEIENISPILAEKLYCSYDSLEGNPLEIEYIANLNETCRFESEKTIKLPVYTSVFNIQNFIPLPIEHFNRSYYQILKNLKHDDENTFNFTDSLYILNKHNCIRGFGNYSEKYIDFLKIDKVCQTIPEGTQKIRISDLLSEPRFNNTFKYVEATYLFDQGQYSVEWENSYNVFDYPEPSAKCAVTINADPSNPNSFLITLKREFDQLQIMRRACEEDYGQWDSVTPNSVITTCEDFKSRLETMLKGNELSQESEYANVWKNDVYQRELDISEQLWTLFKDVTNKKLIKQCTSSMLPILQTNYSQVKLSNSNTTEFHRMLCDRFMKSEARQLTFLGNVELLVEVGLYKLTNDLIYIIKSELPNISQEEQSKLLNSCCRVEGLSIGIDTLNNLFNCVSCVEILKKLLTPLEFKSEASATIRGLLKNIDQKVDFSLQKKFITKMVNIQPSLRTLNCMWIAHFFSDHPVKSHKAVVFEIENSGRKLQLSRYDVELATIKLFV